MSILVAREQWRKSPQRGGLTLDPRWARAEYVWHPRNAPVPGQQVGRDPQAPAGADQFGEFVRSADNGFFNAYGPTFAGRSPSITSVGGWSVVCVYRHVSAGWGQGGLVRTSSRHGLGITAGVPTIYYDNTPRHTSSISAPTTHAAVIIARMRQSGTDEIYIDGELGISAANGGYNYTGTLTRMGSGFGFGHTVGNFHFAASFPWYLSSNEIEALSENPWQIFAPVEKPVFYSLGGGGGPAVLEAAPSATATVTGALTTQIAIAAGATASGAVVAALTTATLLQAAPSGHATVASALTTAVQLASAPAASATVTAALTTQVLLAAAVGGAATVAANLSAGVALASAATASLSAAAALTTQIQLVAAPAAAAVVTANLTAGSSLVASAAGAATVSAALSTGIQLQAAPVGQATVAAALQGGAAALAAAPAGTATLAVALTTGIAVSTSVAAASTVTAALTTQSLLQATAASSATVTAALNASLVVLEAAAVASASFVASLTTQTLMFAAPTAVLALSAGLETRIALAVSLVAVATVSASFGSSFQIGDSMYVRSVRDEQFVRASTDVVYVRAA